MKKIIYSAASLLMFASCSEVELEQGFTSSEDSKSPLTICAASPASRVAISDAWEVAWENGDALMGYDATNVKFEQFTMSKFDATASEFTGGDAANAYRMVYPYDATAVDATYTIDLSTQHTGLKSTYLIGEELVSADAPAAAMKHIGATMNLLIAGCDELAGYTLKAVELVGVSNSVNISAELASTEALTTFGNPNSNTSMLVVVDEDITIAAGVTPEIKFNILPFNLDSEAAITANIQLLGTDGKDYTVTAQVTNNTGTAVHFERAKHHKIQVTCEPATLVEGCKISMVNTENFPEGNDWTIIDAGSLLPGKFAEIQKAIKAHSNKVNITFPNFETIPENALKGCTNLAGVSAPKVTTIGSAAFKECSDLTSASFPAATTLSAINIFQYSGLGSLEVATAADVVLTAMTSRAIGTASKVDLIIGRHNEEFISGKKITVGEETIEFKSIVDEFGDEFASDEPVGPALPVGAVLLSSFDGTTANIPAGTEWKIYVNEEIVNFKNLNTTLKALGNDVTSTLTLTFPDLTTFPASALEGVSNKVNLNLKSVVAPSATIVNNKAFKWAKIETLEIASAAGVKLSTVGTTDPFGYTATCKLMNLILGEANADFVDGTTLTPGNGKSYTLASITLQNNADSIQ